MFHDFNEVTMEVVRYTVICFRGALELHMLELESSQEVVSQLHATGIPCILLWLNPYLANVIFSSVGQTISKDESARCHMLSVRLYVCVSVYAGMASTSRWRW